MFYSSKTTSSNVNKRTPSMLGPVTAGAALLDTSCRNYPVKLPIKLRQRLGANMNMH
jgi:hypothetical protein